MARLYPDINDSKQVLWFKIAWNFYNWALDNGAVGLTEPGFADPIPILEKKAVYYSAVAVELP